ncbi:MULTISPECIES: ribbon-helix-helix domain-containing protein [unclassified Roseitalea]|uniref:ribbon-helix-helix domain-containing protein n=1 Tax=unclassified Roseitalea TaxID=2639107 RepID=UPI00273EB644|nr:MULTISPECIES: ribbon-helix-helix domain-containing protein [unclassified Roseitalea]
MAVRKRSVAIAGHRTSFSVEEPFYRALKRLAEARQISLAALIARIDAERPRDANLSSAIRIHVLNAALAGELGGRPGVHPAVTARRRT